MATVAGAGGERISLRRRQRLPLGDLTNRSSATSDLTRIKPAAWPKPRTSPSAGSSTSSIGSCSSAAPATRCPPPPPPPPPLSAVPGIKGKDKPTREVQSSTCHQKKIKRISKLKTGDMLPGASSPPSKMTRKVYQVTREEQPHMEPLDQSSGEPLPSQDFIDERRAYFAEIDAFELAEEFVSSGSDLD